MTIITFPDGQVLTFLWIPERVYQDYEEIERLTVRVIWSRDG